MSSILTNKGAMVALETLRGINKGLAEVQSQISTGKRVENARDNSAIWAISTVMETDVASFEQIGNSLNLGSATVGVARNASERVTSLLQDAKELIVGAQESNVDRDKIQTDLDELVKEIGTTVNAAQFNGQNLLNSSGSISVLASLDRDTNGDVSATKITVNRQNLTTDAAVTDTLAASDAGGATFAASGLDGSSGAVSDALAITINTAAAGEAEGNSYNFSIQGTDITYTASATDDQDSIAAGIRDAINAAGLTGVTAKIDSTNANEIDFDVTNTNNGSITAVANEQTKVTEAGGGLAGLDALNVTTDEGAEAALDQIEGFLQTAIDASSEFGSKQKRIDQQSEFVTQLSDSLKVGISTLTDANLEEASARLQALQVQQQLGVQALSIANQAPQSLLGLFR
jgi:flagellin